MKKKDITGLLFIVPLMVGISIFLIYPAIESFRLSFYKTNFIESKFLGLKNYIYVLKSEYFYRSLWVTLVMLVYQLVMSIPISFIIASMINKVRVGKSFFRSAYYLPNITSIVAAVIVFKYLFYSTDAGIVNYLLGLVGIKPITWFGEGNVLQFSTALIGTWMVVGYYCLLFLAGMQTIPEELYDAANVDGAKALKMWLYITIPCSKSTFSFVFITGVISCMQRFTDVFVIRGETSIRRPIQTVLLYVYDTSFLNVNYGAGFAASYILFAVIMVITLFNLRTTKIFEEK